MKTSDKIQVAAARTIALLPFPDIKLSDQYENISTNISLRNKYFINAFFFTSCRAICPKMITQMKMVAAVADENKAVLILYQLIDPDRDTRTELYAYSQTIVCLNTGDYYCTN